LNGLIMATTSFMVRPSFLKKRKSRSRLDWRAAQVWHLQVWHLFVRMAQKVAGPAEKRLPQLAPAG
jgi:hypothetical protein